MKFIKLVNVVAMRMEEGFYNISLLLCNENNLEYVQIAWKETESKIPYIESHSKLHESMISIRTISNFHPKIPVISHQCFCLSLVKEICSQFKGIRKAPFSFITTKYWC